MKNRIDENILMIFKKYSDEGNIKSNLEVGLERESLRVQNNKVSEKNHPNILEPKEEHKYITVDYAEGQVEFITPVFNDSKKIINFMENLYDIYANEIGDDLIWPYSMPCDISELENIKEAQFTKSKRNEEAIKYREFLTKKYGKKVQLISGIHFNFSFSISMLKDMYELTDKEKSFETFSDDLYLKVARSYESLKHIIVMLFGATPIVDKSFRNIENGISIRNSKYGYRNTKSLKLDYSSKDNFVKSLKNGIKEGIIDSERENYSSIRLKTSTNEVIKNLKEERIKYIEIRNIDINPYDKLGINEETIEFIKIFLLYCAVDNENYVKCYSENNCREEISLMADLSKGKDGGECGYIKCAKTILLEMIKVCKALNISHASIENQLKKIEEEDILYLNITKDIEEKGYFNFFNELGSKYKKSAYNNRFKYVGLEEMELSTQILIKESIKENINVDILDIEDNFIRLEKNGKVEYVKQATKTSKDNYVTVLAMENKVVTKIILEENFIETPKGKNFTDKEEALYFAKKLVSNYVIKPKSTNFGIGINIFKEEPGSKTLKEAIDIAFDHDKTILIEEYIDGLEYRFLVIGDEVAGVLHRVPANVTGDGKLSIKELVVEKNKNSLRGTGYKTPLEKIKIDGNAKMFLKEKGMDENYVPKKGEVVYLRINSNISTGGDSIDLTDEIHEKFKEIAVKASKSANAVFCGVDIIIDDYKNPYSKYSIIELNFNPAIHIHSYPYKGKEREIATKVLKVLGY